MRMKRFLVGLMVLSGAIVSCGDSNSPGRQGAEFRDCSLAAGVDPDFVELSGAIVTSDGSLTVLPSQNSLGLTASESSDPGDSAGHVTLTSTITSPGIPSQTVSGMGTGRVVLQLPLVGSGAGRVYTISWAATFDNGPHGCPSLLTPANTPIDPHPFVVTVAG
jgi:hypothetical protein